VVYNQLQQQYIHKTVNHAVEYVRGQVHTNGLESFWSLMKRNLAGTYVAVEPFHLDRYLAEQTFVSTIASAGTIWTLSPCHELHRWQAVDLRGTDWQERHWQCHVTLSHGKAR